MRRGERKRSKIVKDRKRGKKEEERSDGEKCRKEEKE